MAKKKSKKKLIIIIVVVVVAAVLVVANLQRGNSGTVTVQTKKAVMADIISEVSGSGRIQPKTKVNITAEVSTEVISIPVKEGDRVIRGTTLIQLDTLQLQKDMESFLYAANELNARLEGAKVLLDQNKEEYERQKMLHEKKLTSEQIYKNAFYAYRTQETNHNALLEQKKAAASRLEKARDNLSKTMLTSPMDGIITLLDVEVGEIAQAQTPYSQGRTLMVVSDMSEFEVEVEIDETDIADLELGQKAKVEIDAFPDTTFEGEIAEIGNTAITTGYGSNDQSTDFMVKIALLNANPKIRPGMSATVDITTTEHMGVLSVPIQAIVMRSFDPDSLENEKPDEEGLIVGPMDAVAATNSNVEDEAEDEEYAEKKKIEKKGVFVNRDGIATFIEVETGIADQQNYEILSGLEKGDEVIIGSFRTLRTIKDDTPIEVNNRREREDESQ
jgi:HlyD family secretion protein